MQIKKLPWFDYSGRLSPLKASVFAALFVPALFTLAYFKLDELGSRPLTEAIHEFGLWTIRFIFISLAISPLRVILQWPRLLLVRRMVGVAAFVYGLGHFSLYIADESFNLLTVASEIVLRIYLTIGFVSLLGLGMLAATSTDGMMRRLGARRWQKLHRIVYGIAFLTVIHFGMQSKLDLWEPMVMAGIYAWLMTCRLVMWRRGGPGRLSLKWAAGLSFGAGVATAVGEALWFWIGMGAPPLLVLGANLSLDTGVRPGWVVFVSTMSCVLLGGLRLMLKRARKARLRPA